MTRLYKRSALHLAALIRSGDVSCREVVQAHLDRIDEVNHRVNALTSVLRESALAAADAADTQADTQIRDQPLRGVPFTVKESIDCAGSATTLGVPRLARQMPYIDAPIVARLKSAGAILIGRTNMSEMGLRLNTDNPLHGPTLNPWLPEVTAGGSSGGDAAALATGMTPLGLGSDLGGSLRSPAYCCGVAALKPTRGRIPHATSLEPRDHGIATQLMLVDGPMARSVADLRACLAVLAGRDIQDPRSVDAPLSGPPPARYRAALVTDIAGASIPRSTVSAIERAGQALAESGWTIERAQAPELERITEVWGRLYALDLSAQLSALRPLLSRPVFDYAVRLRDRFDLQAVPDPVVHAERSQLGRVWSHFLTEYPVVIGPTWTRLPWPPDADLEPADGLAVVEDTARFLLPGSLLGLPSIALPTGVSDGLPTGIQLYADLWREDLCLAAAEIIEAVLEPLTPIDPFGV